MAETPKDKPEEKPKEDEETDEMPPPKPNGLKDYGKPLIVTIPPPFADLARRLLNRSSVSRRMLAGNKKKHCSPHKMHGKKHHHSKGRNCGSDTEEVVDEIKELKNTEEPSKESKTKKDDEVVIEDVVEAREKPASKEAAAETPDLFDFKSFAKGLEFKDGKVVIDFKALKNNFKGKAEEFGDKLKKGFEKRDKAKGFEKQFGKERNLPPWLRFGEFVDKMDKMKDDVNLSEEDMKKAFGEELQHAFGPKFNQFKKFGNKHLSADKQNRGGKGKHFSKRGEKGGFGFHGKGRMSRQKGRQFGQFIQGLADAFNVDLKVDYGSESEEEKAVDDDKKVKENDDQVIEIDIDLDTGKATVLNQEQEKGKESSKKKETVEKEEEEAEKVEEEETAESGLSQEDILKMISDAFNAQKKNKKE